MWIDLKLFQHKPTGGTAEHREELIQNFALLSIYMITYMILCRGHKAINTLPTYCLYILKRLFKYTLLYKPLYILDHLVL